VAGKLTDAAAAVLADLAGRLETLPDVTALVAALAGVHAPSV
jgi:hypothetical protein